jgi:3-hydroxypropanoate dehydrogenase
MHVEPTTVAVQRYLSEPGDTAAEPAKMGPTSANMCPMRLVFVKSKAAKEKLKPALDLGNVDKTMAAPVTAIMGMDIRFYEQLPKLFPHADAKAWFKTCQTISWSTSLSGTTYFILAARSLGLDCGPMSGFNNVKVDAVLDDDLLDGHEFRAVQDGPFDARFFLFGVRVHVRFPFD